MAVLGSVAGAANSLLLGAVSAVLWYFSPSANNSPTNGESG
jgi:hypothetical protein